jgi:hypothetical protein
MFQSLTPSLRNVSTSAPRGHAILVCPLGLPTTAKEIDMCEACDNDNDEFEPVEFDINNLTDDEKEQYFEYVSKQMNLVIDKAESHGVLFDLITEWPRGKVVAFEMATVLENRVLNDDDDE